MANRIVNRAPFSVSTPKDTTNFFIQTEFKGLCDDKNDVTIDPQSFADMENIYVDDNNILSSRAPFKFYDGESYIIKQWQFGEYTLRYYRSVVNEEGNVVTDLTGLTSEQLAKLCFLFTIKCVSHKTAPTDEQNDVWSEKSYKVLITDVGWSYIPKLFFVPIEDKIFGWFAGQDFICFNLVGKYIDNTVCPYFEDGAKYVYLPIHMQVINGIESEVEAKNFLTESYRRRYEYSPLSNVNFQKLEGKYVDVRMQGEDTDNQSKLLYNVTVQRNQEKMLIYPYIVSGGDYEYDIIATPRATVILRYSKSYGTIEVSFDSRIFNPLPKLDNIVATPFLTKDGFYVVVFTTDGIAQYKLVTTTSDEVSYGIGNTSWTINPYFQRGLNADGRITDAVDFSFSPTAYFETIDNFVYCVKRVTTETDTVQYILYTQWLDSANTIRYYSTYLIEDEITSAKVVFKYLAPVDTISDLGPTISLLSHTSLSDKEDSVYTFCCRRSNAHTTGFLYTDRMINVAWNGGDVADVNNMFIWKMDETGKTPISGEIKSGDLVVFSDCPQEMTESDTWQGGITYQAGDWATYRGYVYISKRDNNLNNTPPYSAIGVGSDDYWYTRCPVTEMVTYRVNGQSYTTQISMKHRALRNLSYGRMRVTKANNNLIFTEDDLQFETFNSVINYSPEELTTLLGPFVPASDDNNGTTWATLYPDGMTIDTAPIQIENNGKLTIEYAQNNGSAPIRFTYKIVGKSFVIDGVEYQINSVSTDANNSDIILTSAVINGASISQSFTVATKVLLTEKAGFAEYISSDILFTVDFDHSKIGTENYEPTRTITMLSRESQYFKLSNSNQLLTESYLYDTGVFTELPDNGIIANADTEIIPLLLTDTGAWYSINGEIWTSQVNERNRIQIDEYVNVDVDEQHNRQIVLNNYVPDFAAALNETFFAYRMPETGDNLLEITEIRRDTDEILDDRRSILLYMPKDNEQKTTNPITNLHPLSESNMGVFTGTEVFYVTPTELDDRVMYTALVKSKIPIGCRFGDDIITALDGQVIILPTKRGLAAMAPQDFVATTERTLTYLSDYIQDKYNHFYNDSVLSTMIVQDGHGVQIPPQIKCTNYRYWLLFHKYLDREILAFDTRSNTWWRWTTPYPIRQLSVGSRLHVIMQMDYNPVSEMSIHIPPQKPSLMGVDFLYTDEEVDLAYKINEFPELDSTSVVDIGYYDDTLDGILNGTVLSVPENRFVANRLVLMYADPTISWHITSQKISFGQINNYKNIKAINISARGTQPLEVRFTTKSFRDYYHPESSLTNEIKINDLRTFVQRFNLMHLVNFQYKLQNQYVENEDSYQLRLNSLSIKYEIKERVR